VGKLRRKFLSSGDKYIENIYKKAHKTVIMATAKGNGAFKEHDLVARIHSGRTQK
jgi:hypothetical protein